MQIDKPQTFEPGQVEDFTFSDCEAFTENGHTRPSTVDRSSHLEWTCITSAGHSYLVMSSILC